MKKVSPKQNHIENTAELLEKTKQEKKPYEVEVLGYKFVVYPKVFSPKYFFSTTWYADQISKMVKDEQDFLEIGCGSGVISCIVALRNKTIRISSTDINTEASKNTAANVKMHNLEERMGVFKGDVFDGISESRTKFDSIFWAMPFGFIETDKEMDIFETSVFDPGYRAIKKFFNEAEIYLKPEGRLLIGFSNDIGHYELLEDFAKENNFKLKLLAEDTGVEEKNTVGIQIYEATLTGKK